MSRTRSAAETAIVGREAELDGLRQVYAQVAESSPRVLLLDGEAGVGKSTVVREFVAGLGDAHVVWVDGLETEADLECGVIDRLYRTVGAPADVFGGPIDHIEL